MAITPSGTTADESIRERSSRLILSVRWQSLILLWLGMLMVNQFFSQLGRGRFGSAGFETYTQGLADTANIDRFSRSVLEFLADNATVFAPALAVFVAVSGICLMLLIARPIVGLVVSGFFWVLWYATSATSGIWTFEYLFPAAFGLLAALATLPQLTASSGRDRWLGARVRGELSLRAWALSGVAVSVMLWWFFRIDEGGGQSDYADVALYSAVAFIALLFLTGLFDPYRQADPGRPTGWTARLERFSWIDGGIILVGAMMCIQVFADLQVGWYNTAGYEAQIRQYAESTGAPGWWTSFLELVANNAEIFMPLQAVAEFACALFLVTLLIRPVSLVASFGFFFTLMFSEFGVSATIKQGGELTWEWEMLFVTGIIAMLALATLGRALELRGLQNRILGDGFYPGFGLAQRLAAAATGAGVLWAVGIQTRMFGGGYKTVSWRGALFFFGCLVALAFVEHHRRHRPESEVGRAWGT